MRWKGRQQSRNIEDRRGQAPLRAGSGGAGAAVLLRLLPVLLRNKAGRYLLLVIAAVFALQYFGVPIPGLSLQNQPFDSAARQAPLSAEEEELGRFVSVVLADTEQTWHAILAEEGMQYREPTLVLFTDQVRSACGSASAAMGPFYCPADEKVYIDLSFYQDLRNRFGAPGDFAQAYVIAHEVGHHLQTVLGISQRVREAQRGLDQVAANRVSVKLELQADCFAGVWAHHAGQQRQLLEPGDLEEALTAAAAIGDDRLQQQTQGRVVPDSFTHGSSAQRVAWFQRGVAGGDIASCDTFTAGMNQPSG